MKAFVFLMAMLMLGGCGGQFGPAGMSAEQLRAWAKVKDANAGCVSAKYAGVSINTSWINADKGIPVSAVIDPDCKITLMAPSK